MGVRRDISDGKIGKIGVLVQVGRAGHCERVEMILGALIGACFFAGIVAILTVPWIVGAVDTEAEAH